MANDRSESYKSTYESRIPNFTNKTAIKLLQTISSKKSNLCVSADVDTADELIHLADQLGPYICCLKTHIDIIQDYTPELTNTLKTLAVKHDFLIFEDRKFADIGSTVKKQYSGGIYKISTWADIINAHSVPGIGIINGLKQIATPLNRGLLLLAEMSSKGTLTTQSYANSTLQMAIQHPDFVFGFIGQSRLPSPHDFIYMTPGVHLGMAGDGLGQQYSSPRQVIFERGCDVIIVGRGIYGGGEEGMVGRAEEYRNAGWSAYLERIE